MLPQYSLIQLDADSIEILEEKLFSKSLAHTVVELSDNINITQDKISLFLRTTMLWKENGMSFVLVQKGIDIDSFPEELNIVPTLQEAEDILEMEAIERDLGF